MSRQMGVKRAILPQPGHKSEARRKRRAATMVQTGTPLPRRYRRSYQRTHAQARAGSLPLPRRRWLRTLGRVGDYHRQPGRDGSSIGRPLTTREKHERAVRRIGGVLARQPIVDGRQRAMGHPIHLGGRTPCFGIHTDEAKWEFVLERWRWRISAATSGGSGWIAVADISSKRAMPTSVSRGFQGSVNPGEQCAHPVNFAPETSYK